MRYTRHASRGRRTIQTSLVLDPKEVAMLERLAEGQAFDCHASKGLVMRAALNLLAAFTRRGPVELPSRL
jgi:hypothetical protein